MLGALADGTGFSAAELEDFEAHRAKFWWNCVMAWRKEVADQQTNK